MEFKESLSKDTGEIRIGSFSAPILAPSTLSLRNTELGNSFGLKYRIFGKEDYDVITEIITGNVRDVDLITSVTPRVQRNSDYNTVVEFKYANSSAINMEITPKVNVDYDTEIFVNPNNRMWALYEVQQPPIITDVFNPVKDSFTRSQTSYQTINYGDSLSMLVGRTPEDVLRSFIQFDVSSIDPTYVLTDSYMRLFYKSSPPNSLKLEVLTAGEAWSEYGITDLNRPSPRTLVSSDYTVNTDEGYIEFNLSSIVKDWVANRVVNDGLIIRLSNETEYGQASFNTRETSKPPQLIVNYYDGRIFSTGRAQIPTEISAIHRNEIDRETEITVNAVHGFSEFNTEIRVHIREVPFEDDWLFEITSNKDKIYTEITASIFTEKEFLTIIDARRNLDQEYPFSIAVNRDKVLTEITPIIHMFSDFNTEITITNDYIDTELTVRRSELSDSDTEITVVEKQKVEFNTEITITRDYIDTEIVVRAKGHSECDTEIFVRGTQELDNTTELLVSVPQILIEIDVVRAGESNILTEITALGDIYNERETEIFVKIADYSDISTELIASIPSIGVEITPRLDGSSRPYTIITVSRDFVETEITVKSRSEHDTEITVELASKKATEVTVSRPEILMEITPMISDDSDVLTVIQVPANNDIDTEIIVNVFNQYDTEITVMVRDEHETEIISTRPYLNVEITVPYYATNSRDTEITPRVRLVNNVNTVIQVGKKRGSYVFMM